MMGLQYVLLDGGLSARTVPRGLWAQVFPPLHAAEKGIEIARQHVQIAHKLPASPPGRMEQV